MFGTVRSRRIVLISAAFLGLTAVTSVPVLAQTSTCNGSLFIDYVQPPTPNYASDGDTVRIRLTLGAGTIRNGTILTVDKIRFSLDCRKEVTFPGLCNDDGAVIAYPGDAAAAITTTCPTFWNSGSPGGGLDNELVFDATPNFSIPASAPLFCVLEFNLLVNNIADARDDATMELVEQRAFYGQGDAQCDNGLGSTQKQSASLSICPACGDDGEFCNGVESCDSMLGCVSTGPPDCDDGIGCTVDGCDEVNDSCANTPDDMLCKDGDPCTNDVCDPFVGCAYTPTGLCPAICRPHEFWATHGGTEVAGSQNITLEVTGAGPNGQMTICGETIDDTDYISAGSAIEAMCIPYRRGQRYELVRALTATALNCIMSGGGDAVSECSGVPLFQAAFDECDLICQGPFNHLPYEACFLKLECLNRGGVPLAGGGCQIGTCANGDPCDVFAPCADGSTCTRFPDNCYDRPLINLLVGLDFEPPGPPGSSVACTVATRTGCTVIPPGESLCNRWSNDPD